MLQPIVRRRVRPTSERPPSAGDHESIYDAAISPVMASPTTIKISVTGTLNRTHFTASGRLAVDPTVGTKVGHITFKPLPR